MAGLAKICKQFGGITVRTHDGVPVDWVWDYANDLAVKSAEMPKGSERWKASERARWSSAKPNNSSKRST